MGSGLKYQIDERLQLSYCGAELTSRSLLKSRFSGLLILPGTGQLLRPADIAKYLSRGFR